MNTRDTDARNDDHRLDGARVDAEQPEPVNVMRRGVRIVLMYIGWHRRVFSIAVFGAAVYAAMTVASTFVLARITDKVLTPAFKTGVTRGTILAWVAVMVCVAIIKAAGIVTRRTFAGLTGFRSARTLQKQITEKYAALPLSYFRREPTGELLAHVEADVQAAVDALHPLPYSTAVLLLILFAMGALLYTDLFLAAIGFVVLPTLAFMNHWFTQKYEPVSKLAQDRIGEVSAVAHESFDGALVVKTLGREADEVTRLSTTAGKLRDARLQQGRLRAGYEPTLSLVPDLGVVALVAVGAWRISSGAITPGKLVQFIFLFNLLAWPMRLIGWLLADLPRSVVAYERLRQVFDEPIALLPPSDPRPLPAGPLGLEARNVFFRYAEAPVLSGVSFIVRPGTSVAVVGATGSGKSTLSQLLVRLDDPESGSISLGGVDVRTVAPSDLRSSAALVFQESYLFVDTIRHNIALGLEVSDADVKRAARLAQADRFISRLPNGYDTAMGERGVTLSGGQRQRVALARALVRNPRLLILDDATSAVDPTIEAAILNGLRDELAATLVVIAYRISTITLADQVLFLENGVITRAGTHQELLEYPPYDAMVRAYETVSASEGVDHE